MPELGQFLAGPGVILNPLSPWMLPGFMVLCATLGISVSLLLKPLAKDVSSIRIAAFIPLVAVACILVVCLAQWAAAGVYNQGPESTRYVRGGGGVRFALERILLWLLLYLVGWGYSRSLHPDSFEGHILSFTLGVGVLEELVKAIAGVCLASALFRESRKWTQSRRLLALPFTVAGLGFGAGEAIFYFQVYAGLNLELSFYLLRAVWCVLLHGSWSFLTAMLLYGVKFDLDPASPDSDAALVAKFIGCSLPAAFLHGLYDASCMHSVGALWIIGGICIIVSVAWLLFLRESALDGSLQLTRL